jgi:hypothetical protein
MQHASEDPFGFELEPGSESDRDTLKLIEDSLGYDEFSVLFDVDKFEEEHEDKAQKTADSWQQLWEEGADKKKVEIMKCEKRGDDDHYTIKSACEGEVERVLCSIQQGMMVADSNYSFVMYDSEPQKVEGIGFDGSRNFAFRCWKVVSIERIQNRYVRNRFLDFGKSMMDNPVSEWVFHGTGEAAADAIRDWGFSEKHVLRAAFGIGINTSSSMLTSLQFCKAFLVGTQIHYKVIVSDYYKGHTAIGTTNQRDFGETDCGKPITNLVAPPEKGHVNVARFTDQLCPLYEVTLIIDTTRDMTENEIRTVFINAAPYSNYFVLEWIAAGNIKNQEILLTRTRYPSILENLKKKGFIRNAPPTSSKSSQLSLPQAVSVGASVVSNGGSSSVVSGLPGTVVVSGNKRPSSSSSTMQQPAKKVAKKAENDKTQYGFRVPCTLTGWTDLTTSGARNIEQGHSIIIRNKMLLCVEYAEFVDTVQHFKVVKIMQSLGNMIFFYLRPVTQDTRDKIEHEIWPARKELFEKFLDLPKDCIVCKRDSMLRF